MKNKKLEKIDDPLAEDWSGYIGTLKFRKASFIFAPKNTTVTLRVPEALLAVAKRVAKRKGIKYQRIMREAIIDYLVKAEAEPKELLKKDRKRNKAILK